MSKKQRDSDKAETTVEKALIPESGAYFGVVLFVVGVAMMYMSGRVRPGAPSLLNYAGIGLAVCGGLLWFISGMDRAQLFEWLRSGLTALALALIIRWAVAEPYRIPSGSMEPTLHGDPRFGRGDRVFVNKWIYGLRYPFMNKRIWYGRAPERWEQVVFKTVEEDAIHKTLVKRIVGMPGEHIQIRNGQIHIDGRPIPLPPDMAQNTYFTTPLDGPYGVQPSETFSQIPEGHYLVLGDNSAYSRDGRYFGWLPNEHIVGRVSCIWWPPQRWRDFTGFSKTLWWRALVALIVLSVLLRLFVGRFCPAHRPDTDKGLEHLVVSFAHYGLHVPFANLTLPLWRKPQRGELVLYRMHEKEQGVSHMLIGRIAGLPGERVQLQDGALAVNDEAITLPPPAPKQYPAHASARYGRAKAKEYSAVPQGCYYILSDSVCGAQPPLDSRVLGWVPERQVQGRAVCCWWPPARMGRR